MCRRAYDLALFDLDGTLTDPKEGITKAAAYALNALGVKVKDINELTTFIGPPLREAFVEYYGFTADEAEFATAKYREYFSPKGIFENKPYDDVIAALDVLKNNGVRLAIATCKPWPFAERIAEKFGFRDCFEFLSGSELDGARAKKGEVIKFALDNLDPRRELKTVMIGDRAHDIIGARENDIECVGVLWGYGSRAELSRAKAAFLAETPAEMVNRIISASEE